MPLFPIPLKAEEKERERERERVRERIAFLAMKRFICILRS